MDKKRYYEYKRQIHKLQEKDKQTTLRVQTELNRMDDQEKRKDKKMRAEILAMKKYEVEMDSETHYVRVNLYDDKKEQCTIISLCGDYFNREEYECSDPDPTMAKSKGVENIFSGDNEAHWDGSDVFEIFYNNIMKFDIQTENY